MIIAPHRKLVLAIAAAAMVLAATVVACSTSPLGRRQVQLFPSSVVRELGEHAFSQIKGTTPRLEDAELSAYVGCVAGAITRHVDAADWEVVLFDQESVNAFALPGRKIGIYRGMLGVAETQDQLATVIAHEVAHILAEHANERLSTEYLIRASFDAIRGRISTSPEALAALGLGAQVGILLPYSRKHEEEADLLGLRLMARAGFDPDAALLLWGKMAERDRRRVPELLSTHPADEARSLAIQAALPEAYATYQEALRSAGRPLCSSPATATRRSE